MSKAHKTTGIVLAGGKSSRMGTDKGLMLLHGKPMVTYVLEQLKPCVDDIIIVANKEEYKQFGYPVVPDMIEAIGPAGGIYTGLNASQTELNFFVSCDTPFVSTEAILQLIQHAQGTPICIATLKGQLQPLFGVYSKVCIPIFKEGIEQENYKLQALIRQSKHTLVAMDVLVKQQPYLFQNINTPQEFEEALKQIEQWK
jgi:molybdenum cofactor guanylyltransferase